MEMSVRSVRRRFAAADKRWWLSKARADRWVLPMHTYSKKGKAVACRIATPFAAVVMGISCIATDASATCMFKAKKDIIVILDVGHTDKDSGQISARGVKEYDLNMRLAQRVLDRKSTRLNSSHLGISYAVFCLKKKKIQDL